MFTEEKAIWLYRHYRWLDAHLPKRHSGAAPAFVLPTPEFFPDPYSADYAGAERVFSRVKELMGMSEWACRFELRDAQENDLQADLSRSGVLGDTSARDPAGTFSVTEERDVVISCSTNVLARPTAWIATLAHELCHFLLATVEAEPPSSWSELEPLTDLTAVREGFGIFLSNAAFQFSQWNGAFHHGWNASRQGYLSEAELGFCTAIFAVRNKIDPNIASRALKPNPREVFCDAIDYVAELETEFGAD